jgi:hypothetical protein
LFFSRELTAQLRFQLSGSYEVADFEVPANDFREAHGGAGFVWRMGRMLSTIVQYDYFDRTSDAPLNTYTENQVWLRIRYGSPVAANGQRQVPTSSRYPSAAQPAN